MTEYPYTAMLRWDMMPNDGRWNEICAWSIERFGLTGDRWRTEVCTDWMRWSFRDPRDQLIFITAWGTHD